VALRFPQTPEVLVERVDIPRHLRPGECLRPYGQSPEATSPLRTCEGVPESFLVERATSALKSATKRLHRANQHSDGTFVTYEVEIIPQQDTRAGRINGAAQATATLRWELVCARGRPL